MWCNRHAPRFSDSDLRCVGGLVCAVAKASLSLRLSARPCCLDFCNGCNARGAYDVCELAPAPPAKYQSLCVREGREDHRCRALPNRHVGTAPLPRPACPAPRQRALPLGPGLALPPQVLGPRAARPSLQSYALQATLGQCIYSISLHKKPAENLQRPPQGSAFMPIRPGLPPACVQPRSADEPTTAPSPHKLSAPPCIQHLADICWHHDSKLSPPPRQSGDSAAVPQPSSLSLSLLTVAPALRRQSTTST